MTRPEYGGAWPRIRKQVLARDGNLCQIKAPGCTTRAEHVDHIIPVSAGGAWWDMTNLRASCRKCNLGRVDRSGDNAWQLSPTRITLVVGPPGSPAKADHVAENRNRSDLVIDYDALAAALGATTDDLHEAPRVARNAVLRSLRGGKIATPHAWIISSNPDAESFLPFHDSIVIDPGRRVATDHALQADPTGHLASLVGAWYEARAGRTGTQAGGTPAGSRDWLAK